MWWKVMGLAALVVVLPLAVADGGLIVETETETVEESKSYEFGSVGDVIVVCPSAGGECFDVPDAEQIALDAEQGSEDLVTIEDPSVDELTMRIEDTIFGLVGGWYQYQSDDEVSHFCGETTVPVPEGKDRMFIGVNGPYQEATDCGNAAVTQYGTISTSWSISWDAVRVDPDDPPTSEPSISIEEASGNRDVSDNEVRVWVDIEGDVSTGGYPWMWTPVEGNVSVTLSSLCWDDVWCAHQLYEQVIEFDLETEDDGTFEAEIGPFTYAVDGSGYTCNDLDMEALGLHHEGDGTSMATEERTIEVCA